MELWGFAPEFPIPELEKTTVKTIKVMPWGDDQGDFVLINEDDFDASVHQRYEEGAKKAGTQGKAPTVDELKAALAEKGIEIPEGAKKADLQALLDKAVAGDAGTSASGTQG